METKSGVETEGKATQRLPYLGIHPINSHQTRHYYGRHEVYSKRSMPWLSPMEELDGSPEELKGFIAP